LDDLKNKEKSQAFSLFVLKRLVFKIKKSYFLVFRDEKAYAIGYFLSTIDYFIRVIHEISGL